MKKTPTAIWIAGLLLGQLLFLHSASAEERFFEIKAKKFSYTPNVLKVNKGDTVRIRLISEDVHHGFFLDGYGVRTTALPGQDGSLEFVADKPGRYIFRCSVTCGEFHPYMIGHLRVAPNTTFYFFVTAMFVLAALCMLFALTRRCEEQTDG